MIYLDNSATTQTLETAAKAAYTAMTEGYYNPSAAYGPAVEVERKVNAVRTLIAKTMFANPAEIIFTSGATESNNMAAIGFLKKQRTACSIITSAVEHPSVHTLFSKLASNMVNPIEVGVDSTGHILLDELNDKLSPGTAFVSVMHVNNELGTITDLNAVASVIKDKAPNACFHCDGVQAYMKLAPRKLPVDMYSVSGHKFHAPKGVGFLYVNSMIGFAGGLIGGGQEYNLRSGTTNAPSIIAMGEAVRAYLHNMDQWHKTLMDCKQRLYSNLSTMDGVFLNGPAIDKGAPHILNLSFDGVRGEVLLHALEQLGVYVSTGSACSTHKKGSNRILNAIGVKGGRQEGTIRFSFSPFNTVEQIDTASQAIIEQVTLLRKYRRR